jgi:hypothetical protein
MEIKSTTQGKKKKENEAEKKRSPYEKFNLLCWGLRGSWVLTTFSALI